MILLTHNIARYSFSFKHPTAKTGSEQRSSTMRDFVCKRRDTRPTLSAQWLMSYSLSILPILSLTLFSSHPSRAPISICPLFHPLFPFPAALHSVSQEKRSILRQMIGHCERESLCKRVEIRAVRCIKVLNSTRFYKSLLSQD